MMITPQNNLNADIAPFSLLEKRRGGGGHAGVVVKVQVQVGIPVVRVVVKKVAEVVAQVALVLPMDPVDLVAVVAPLALQYFFLDRYLKVSLLQSPMVPEEDL